MAQDLAKLAMIQDAAHAVLAPLGFKKHKTNWRRELPEVLQQFSLVKKPLGPSWYGPEWGLNLSARSENPRPLPHQLHVRWILEFSVGPRKKMLEIAEALKLWTNVPDAARLRRVTALLREHVLPTFELYRTAEAVRLMAGDYAAPFRAQGLSGCPADWLPPDE